MVSWWEQEHLGEVNICNPSGFFKESYTFIKDVCNIGLTH